MTQRGALPLPCSPAHNLLINTAEIHVFSHLTMRA